MGEAESGGLKLDFDGHLRLEFMGAKVTTDAGLLRQSVYARLAGYEDVDDQERLFRGPAMRAVIGRKALGRNTASS